MSDVRDVARQDFALRDIIRTTQRTDMMLCLHGNRMHRLRSILELTLRAMVIRTSCRSVRIQTHKTNSGPPKRMLG